jgi:hypothetical protein
MRVKKRVVLALAAAIVALAPITMAAQATAADAEKFIGGWTLGLETPQGAMSLDLTIKGDGGKVLADITSPLGPDKQTINDISKEGDNLVLKYTMDIQGMPIPAKITLKPAGEKMGVSFDFADGQFQLDGTAAKK